MIEYQIKNEVIRFFNKSNTAVFPKYTSQIINLANQNAQGTRPVVVGQMSDLFPMFMESGSDITILNWNKWYEQEYPDAIQKAADKIFNQLQSLKSAISLIDYEMVERWVKDLIVDKTFNGMYVQKAIIAFLAEKKAKPYRLATRKEEAIGIDGFVGDIPYSIKPHTYKTKQQLPESIDIKMIYYYKTKAGLKIEVEE